MGDINLTSLSPSQKPIAELIVRRFSEAGFGTVQQLAAVANAIGESNLNPKSHSAGGDDCVGLFQLNRNGDLGHGFTVEQLMDPDTNIGIIIKEAKKFEAFGTATSIETAVDVFVRKVERPIDPDRAVAKRVAIAQSLGA
jgi:Phage tail lysozyme